MECLRGTFAYYRRDTCGARFAGASTPENPKPLILFPGKISQRWHDECTRVIADRGDPFGSPKKSMANGSDNQ
jgi:hypothetical protein